jgi:diguanylate cyclase (GGDEF)-like protein
VAEPAAKILVADDSATERANARNALEPEYKIVEAADGQEALEAFTREAPDLVMLDVVMPRLTGLETCRILKAKAHGTYLPVIMLSTRNSVNARVEGLRSGADDYLGKPYDPEELRARIEALLRTRAVLARAHESGPGMTRTRMLLADSAARGESALQVFRRRASEEFDRAERYSDPLACLRVALDGAAGIRAGFGDAAMERMMKQLRQLIEQSVRKVDLVFAVEDGGYAILLPNTHFPGALAVAERVVLDAGKLERPERSGEPPTVSVGVSFYPNRDTGSVIDLLGFVDAALERAQSEGRGQICLYQHQGYLYAPEV